jgi:hypothetical protein
LIGVDRKWSVHSPYGANDPNEARREHYTIGVILVGIADGQRGQPGRVGVGRFESGFQAQIPMP